MRIRWRGTEGNAGPGPASVARNMNPLHLAMGVAEGRCIPGQKGKSELYNGS